MDPETVGALIGPILTAALAAPAVGFQEWQRHRESADQQRSYPGPLPNQPPGPVGAGYPPG